MGSIVAFVHQVHHSIVVHDTETWPWNLATSPNTEQPPTSAELWKQIE